MPKVSKNNSSQAVTLSPADIADKVVSTFFAGREAVQAADIEADKIKSQSRGRMLAMLVDVTSNLPAITSDVFDATLKDAFKAGIAKRVSEKSVNAVLSKMKLAYLALVNKIPVQAGDNVDGYVNRAREELKAQGIYTPANAGGNKSGESRKGEATSTRAPRTTNAASKGETLMDDMCDAAALLCKGDLALAKMLVSVSQAAPELFAKVIRHMANGGTFTLSQPVKSNGSGATLTAPF
jgi:hypothetical protein